MERRDFMKLCSVAGLGLVGTGLSGEKEAKAALEMAPQLFVEVSANGGWDITAGIDPKGNPINALYTVNDIQQFGNVTVAPDLDPNTGTILSGGPIQNFFSKWASRFTILRGVDCETNGHDTGQMNTWSGRLQNGSPAFAALLAAATGPDKPLGFITNGGYSFTAGVMAPTRLGDLDTLQELIYPNRRNVTEPDNLYHTEETFKRILATRQERLNKYQQLQNLPKIKQSMSLLYTSRLGMEDLKKINDYLPTQEELDALPNGMARQAAIVLASYMAGLTSSATLSTGGFDSHGDNDNAQWNNQATIWNGLDALLTRATDLGIIENLVVMVGSDFGRTPDYNGAQGRDHWSVGAMMVMGKGIPGDRVVGATDDGLVNKNMDFGSLQVNDGGEALTCGHVHKWLRRYFGVENHEVVKMFPIPKEGDINLGMPA